MGNAENPDVRYRLVYHLVERKLMVQNAAQQSWKGSHTTREETAFRLPAQHATQHCNDGPRFESSPEIHITKAALVLSNKQKHVWCWGAEEQSLGIVLQVTSTNFILCRRWV